MSLLTELGSIIHHPSYKHCAPDGAGNLCRCQWVWFAESLPSLLQFWERAIPKADRHSPNLITSFISNRVIQELRLLAEGGTPLGYLTGMVTENRRAGLTAAMAAQTVW